MKDKDGRENAAARVLDAEPEDDTGGCCGDDGTLPAPDKEGAVSLRRGRLWSCKAFAKAFSCVRTKWARCLMNCWPSSESISPDTCGFLGDFLWSGITSRNWEEWWRWIRSLIKYYGRG